MLGGTRVSWLVCVGLGVHAGHVARFNMQQRACDAREVLLGLTARRAWHAGRGLVRWAVGPPRGAGLARLGTQRVSSTP